MLWRLVFVGVRGFGREVMGELDSVSIGFGGGMGERFGVTEEGEEKVTYYRPICWIPL